MEKRMERSLIYNGTITAEQFLFYEIRIASKYYLDGTSVEDAIEEIKKNNLFQYPTERLVDRMVRSCYKRLDALDDEQLRQELSSAPVEIAKQINLYAMMRYQRDLLARLRTDYVHEQQERYRTQLAQLGDAIDHASASERVKLTKQQKKFQDQATELQKYEERVHHLADQNIEIDLDDGVKHNYELFADVLAKIK